MQTSWSSRDRLWAAMSCEQPDILPCSFMLFRALRDRCKNQYDFIEQQLGLGLDAYVELPPRPQVVVNDHYNLHGLPVSFHPIVSSREWVEKSHEGAAPLMIREYETPAGVLRAEVLQSNDWRWGDHVPFLDDYVIPRSVRFPVTRFEDLSALRYLLVSPTKAEISQFRYESQSFIDLAHQRGLLIAGGWGVGADLAGWVAGLENLVFATYDQPDFVQELLNIIAAWNMERMAIVLETGVDLYIKRAWYENCDFWTPENWYKYIFPILKADAALAHQAEAKLGYIITSNCMPLLDLIAEADVDVIIGVDPQAWDMETAKKKLGGRVCLWGGVNGHLTMELGTPNEVRNAVQFAINTLAHDGGFILSPVDNVRLDTPKAMENVSVMINEWKRFVAK